MLELVLDRPDWLNALGVALTRPPGVPERRAGQDPWNPAPEGEQKRPRRIADDLAWLRQAYDEPEENGLTPAQGHRRRRRLGARRRRARTACSGCASATCSTQPASCSTRATTTKPSLSPLSDHHPISCCASGPAPGAPNATSVEPVRPGLERPRDLG